MHLLWSGGSSMHSTTHPWPLMAWPVFWFFIPYGLLLLRARPCLIVGFSFFSLLFCSFRSLATVPNMLLCYSCCSVIWPQLVGPLLGLLHIPFSIAIMTQYGHWIYTYATLGFLDSLHYLWAPLSHFFPLWASLTHLLSLDILGPFFNSAFSWAFTNSFGLPQPNYLILHP